jgi:hypothetical protein
MADPMYTASVYELNFVSETTWSTGGLRDSLYLGGNNTLLSKTPVLRVILIIRSVPIDQNRAICSLLRDYGLCWHGLYCRSHGRFCVRLLQVFSRRQLLQHRSAGNPGQQFWSMSCRSCGSGTSAFHWISIRLRGRSAAATGRGSGFDFWARCSFQLLVDRGHWRLCLGGRGSPEGCRRSIMLSVGARASEAFFLFCVLEEFILGEVAD